MMITPFSSVDAARRGVKVAFLLIQLSFAASISVMVLNDVALMPSVVAWLSVSVGFTASGRARLHKIKATIGRRPMRQELAETHAHSAAGEVAPDRELQDAMIQNGATREAVIMVAFMVLVGGGAALVAATTSTGSLDYAFTAFSVVGTGVASYLWVKIVAGYKALARRGS